MNHPHFTILPGEALESRQAVVARAVSAQLNAGASEVFGVMIESFLVAGRQDLVDPATLRYGQSITDACMGFEETVGVLQDLAAAVRARRSGSEPRRCTRR